jgi:hypothetical protein
MGQPGETFVTDVPSGSELGIPYNIFDSISETYIGAVFRQCA